MGDVNGDHRRVADNLADGIGDIAMDVELDDAVNRLGHEETGIIDRNLRVEGIVGVDDLQIAVICHRHDAFADRHGEGDGFAQVAESDLEAAAILPLTDFWHFGRSWSSAGSSAASAAGASAGSGGGGGSGWLLPPHAASNAAIASTTTSSVTVFHMGFVRCFIRSAS